MAKAGKRAAGSPDELTPICGIGASAGGIKALQQFFQAIDPELGLAYVVIVHLAPDFPSHLSEILDGWTSMGGSHVPSSVRRSCLIGPASPCRAGRPPRRR